jgi:hypothetical protein
MLLTVQTPGAGSGFGNDGRRLQHRSLSVLYYVCGLICISDVSYILFEVPSNIALRKLRPAFYFPALMLGWGIVLSPFVVLMTLDHGVNEPC